MLQEVSIRTRQKSLDRKSWHNPLVSVVVTHFDYSDHIEDALLSLVDQTHENWECVVVDDCSSSSHVRAVEAIIDRIGSPKISLVKLDQNEGQIGTFFAGLTRTSGEFISLLDPDDRYDENFIEAALACHLNQVVMCPIVSTDQFLVKNGSVISQVNSHYLLSSATWAGGRVVVGETIERPLFYTPADQRGWHWTSTSSLMMRRSALSYLKPHKPLHARNSVDSYVAQGLHRLGGTLFLAKPLVYRILHDRNDYITDALFSSNQSQARPDALDLSRKLLLDAIEVLEHNGAPKICVGYDKKRDRLAKLRRSFGKRWRRLTQMLPYSHDLNR